MKIFNYALCAIAGVIIFSSCSKPDVAGGTDETRSVTIRIGNDATRAVDDPAEVNGSDYSSLHIYFTDGSKVVSSDVITAVDAITDFKANGKSYDNISASITSVLIVANVKSGDALPVAAGTDVSAIKGFAFALASQQPGMNAAEPNENTKGKGLQVTMMGEDATLENDGVPVAGIQKKKAEVVLTPVVARVEISGIPTPETKGGIKSIDKVEHIYLNCYHNTHAATYSDTDLNYINKKTDVTQYTDNLQNANYNTEVVNTKIDAYHLFANSSSTKMPHIILKVSGVFDDGAGGAGESFTKYLTITKFRDNVKNPIEYMSPNNIYKVDLSELYVYASDLDPTPEAGRINLAVSVTVADWTVVNATPEL